MKDPHIRAHVDAFTTALDMLRQYAADREALHAATCGDAPQGTLLFELTQISMALLKPVAQVQGMTVQQAIDKLSFDALILQAQDDD